MSRSLLGLLSLTFCTLTVSVVHAEVDAERYGANAGYPLAVNYWLGEKDEYAVAEYSGERLTKPHNYYSGKLEAAWVRKDTNLATPLNRTEVSWGAFNDPNHWIEKNVVLAVAIYKEGQLLLEKYQYGRRPDHRFNSQSMAKTVSALAIGIGVDDGKIDIDLPVEHYLPYLKGTPLGKVSIRNHLKMASGSGFRWDAKGDAKKYFLQKFAPPCGTSSGGVTLDFCGVDVRSLWAEVDAPSPQGVSFNYDPMSSDILSAVVSSVYGKPLSKVLEERVWRKIGAEDDAYWNFMWATPTQPKMTSGANFLHARLNDWVRLSRLFVDDKSNDVISKRWLEQMVSDKLSTSSYHLHQPSMVEYGYQTWIAKNYFAMEGYRGQEILIDPKSKTIMVVFALRGDWKKDGHKFFEWLINQSLDDMRKK
jgi:CubicO group peptidase (beta-lactamase class C family)